MNSPQKATDTDLKYFAGFIEGDLGIVYDEGNFFQLEGRLKEICKNFDIESITKLRGKAESEGITGHFRQLLLDTATNNETSFYRDKKAFNVLEQTVLPSIIEASGHKNRIRVWTVACSTGQEPYTLAMIGDRLTSRFGAGFELLATDISDRVLQYAKTGCYSQLEIQRGLPATDLVKYFEKDEHNHWGVKAHLKKGIQFSKMNLLDIDRSKGLFELILCRNVLIYQRAEKKQEIIQKLSTFLAPGGHLMLGAAESLVGVESDLERHIVEGSMFYKKI